MKDNLYTISISEARFLALYNQRLLESPQKKSGRKTNVTLRSAQGLLDIIEQLGYVQIDTISVVERSHKHILWTRFPAYKEELLNTLIDKDKKVFEYWAHAAAFLPMRDYRFTLYRKRKFTHYNKSWGAWSKKNKKVIQYVIDRIKDEGPLQSRDFEHPKKRGTWWDWKPTKHALEYLFHTGVLMVNARKNFQKVYDLAERILPADIISSELTDEEHSKHLIMSAIRANGIVTKNEITYQKFFSGAAYEKTLKHLANEKQIVKIKVENIKEEYYSTLEELDRLNNENRVQDLIHILSPFDNLVIQRKRLKNLFNFDYVIECYVPAHKRKFGYFCLPVLYGNKFIGRIDAKADRLKKTLIINNFFPENGIKKNFKSNPEFKSKLKELAEFSGCAKIIHN